MATSGWEQFGIISKLNLAIQGTPENQQPRIYANSRNMVEVVITVELLDKNSNKLNVTDDEIKQKLYFCRSETGQNLGSPWQTFDNPNEYVNGSGTFSSKSSDSDSIRFVLKYIACSRHERDEITEKISVGINIPGVGKYDTSLYGTSTNMGAHGTFHSPKAYEITALRPIDYGIPSNIKIYCGEFETVETGLQYVTLSSFPMFPYPFTQSIEHWDGKCQRRIVYIRPNETVTHQQKFKKHEIVYDVIKNSDVSTGTITRMPPPFLFQPATEDAGFSLLKEGYANPGAVIGRGWHHDDFQVNLWFSRRNHVGIDGKFYAGDDRFYYIFNDNRKFIEKYHFDDDENGASTLVLYKLIMPVHSHDKWKSNWQDVIRNMTVNVTDYYGNDGTFRLIFDDKDKFDEPGII